MATWLVKDLAVAFAQGLTIWSKLHCKCTIRPNQFNFWGQIKFLFNKFEGSIGRKSNMYMLQLIFDLR